jgi:polyisoprenoid-binding protein YceI
MRKPLFAAVCALLLSAAAGAAEYEFDGAHTYPMFAISHSGLSTLHGRFDDTRGRFVLDREGGKSRVEAVIRVDSLDTGDEPRDKILRGEKFFDAAKYPEMRYTSRRIEFTGDTTATVEGELSLHGVTRPVTLKVEHLVCGTHPLLRVWACGFDATATIKRSDFGMTAYLPRIVGDEVRIVIAAEARRVEAPGARR